MSQVIDLTDSRWSWPESAIGDVLLLVNPDSGPAAGELGDMVLWTTQGGVARGEVIGWETIDGPPPIPSTRVKVTAVPHRNKS